MSDGDLFGNNGTTNGSQAKNAISHPIRSRSHSSGQQIPCSNSALEYNYRNDVESGHASVADLVSSSSSVNPSLSPLPNKCTENLQSHVAVAASNYYTKNNYYCHTFGSGAPSHSSGSSDTHSSRRPSSNLCETSRGRYPDTLVEQGSLVAVDGDGESDKNWLEEIQFKAQYKHFRSNNYSSVVNSANSLDKLRVDVDSSARISAPNVSQKESQQGNTEEPLKERHSLCWSFPRVKLGRIFNAKSLEDILGRNRKSQNQSPYHTPHQSQTSSGVIGKKRSRFRQQSQSNSSLVSSNKPLSTSPPHHLSTSSSENNCSFITRVATSQPDTIPGVEVPSTISGGSSSFAKAKLLAPVPVNTNSDRGSGSNSKIISSTVSNTPGNISYIKKSSKISSRTTQNPQVSCAKSDNCLNRIVVSAALCTNRLIRSSVDNIDTAISQQEPCSAKKKSLVLNVPLAQKNLKKSILEPVPVTYSKTGLCFGKKPNKINPDSEGIFPTSGNETISNSHINSSESQNKFLSTESSSRTAENIIHLTTHPIIAMTKKKNVNSSVHKPFAVGKQKASSAVEKEKAQLVVANVSYLQRPVSPCRPNASPTFDLVSGSGLGNVTSSNYCPQQHQNEPTSPYYNNHPNQTTLNMPISSYNYNTGVGSYASHFADVRNTNTNAKKVNTNFLPSFDSSNIKQSRLGFVSHHNNNITFPSSSNSIIGGGDYAAQAPGLSSAAVLNNYKANPKDPLKQINLTSSTLPTVGPDGVSLLKPKNKSLPPVPNSLSYRDQNVDNSLGLDHQIRQEHCEPSASKRSGDQNNSSEETSWGGPSYYYQFQNLKIEEPNLRISEDSDSKADGDTVMDLQSPQYVKRTAHMFNLRYTSQLNESSTSSESAQRNPSYLNVSRSVCGYSCLSYNNGTSTTKTTNSSSGNTPKAPPFPPKVSSGIRSDLSIVFKTNSLNGKGEESRESSSSPPPPPLPKSMAPKFVSTINIENNSTISKENGKSFIMQKIERLYGSEAVSSPGLLLKRSSLSSDERIIPISVEGRSHDSNNKSQWKSQSQSKEQTLYSTRRFSSQATQDASNDSVEGTSVLSPVRNRIVSPNKIPVDDLNKCSDSLMFVVKKGKQESCVSNLNLNIKEPTRYENGHKAANDSGFGDKDLDPDVDTEDIVNNEDTNLIHRNGNLKEDIDVQCTGEPTGVSSALSLESSTSISPVGSTADDSGLGEGEDKLPFSVKVKPKPKPKPKDMALRRTARNVDKTAAIPSNREDILIVGDDVTDSEAIINPTLPSPKQCDPVLESSSGKEVASLEGVESETKMNTANKENEDVVVKNGKFFINEMEKAKSLIEQRIFKATEELDLDDDPNSERAGRIRAAIGKANLLIKKKFKQFHELCQANLAEQEEKLDNKPFQTKNEDLAGFWDMVYIQVEEIFQMFIDLEKRGDDSSFIDKPDSATAAPAKTSGMPRKVGSQTTVKAVSKSSAPAKSSAAAARDESRRRLLAEKRRALKNQAAAPKAAEEEGEVQFFVPDSTQRS